MNKEELKKLAKLTLSQKTLDKKFIDTVLPKLSRGQLATYLRILKSLASKKIVTVTSSAPLSDRFKKEIKDKFSDQEVNFATEKIGDGVKIQIDDTIIDLSITSFVNETIENLKATYA